MASSKRSTLLLNIYWFPLILGISSIQNLNVAEQELEANRLISDANDQLIFFQQRKREQEWGSSTGSTESTNALPRIDLEDLAKQLRSNLTNLCSKLKHFEYQKFQNENLKRQIVLLSDMQSEGLNEQDYERIQELKKIMNNFATVTNICSYKDRNICNVAYYPNITWILGKTRSADVLKFYWVAWRDRHGKKARETFNEFVRLYTKAATLNFHVTPSKTWYLYYEDSNFGAELAEAMEQLSPFYREFHAYVRHLLRLQYGTDIDPTGPIPQHLMEQAMSHAWKPSSVLGTPFPHRQLPNIKETMQNLDLTGRKLVESGDRFYQSLGLPPFPETFWTEFLKEKSEKEAGFDCRADIIDLNPNVGFKYCPKVDFRKLLQIHRDIGEIHYLLLRNRFPIALNTEACPGFGTYIGEAAILSGSSPRHLKGIELIANYTLDNELSLNRLFRLGVHTMFTLPMYYVNERFWTDVLDYKIKPDNYNCGYWKIQQEIAGVDPPVERNENHFDPGVKFYQGLDENKSHTIKVLSEILGYQIYKALCLKSGSYIPGNPDFPLSNCDFFGSTDVGKALYDVMSLGSTKHWRDALATLTGERRLNSQAILEFYQPLFDWLKAQNEKLNIHVGWEATEKCKDPDDDDDEDDD